MSQVRGLYVIGMAEEYNGADEKLGCVCFNAGLSGMLNTA